jgi:hypothetical protein
MTDFNGINPEKNTGAGFNANRQSQGQQPEADAGQDAPVPTDPYADLKIDPDYLLKLLGAQAKLNLPAGVENAGVDKTVAGFTDTISPERHARVIRVFEQAYSQEFGASPSPGLLQDMVDDYLIGRVNVQSA